MDMSELQPIIDLMTLQEERLYLKMKELHEDIRETRDDVKETQKEVKKINGSLRDAQLKIKDIESNCKVRNAGCALTIQNAQKASWLLNHLNAMVEKPKTTIVLIILAILGLQTIVLKAVEENWMAKIWDFVKLIF